MMNATILADAFYAACEGDVKVGEAMDNATALHVTAALLAFEGLENGKAVVTSANLATALKARFAVAPLIGSNGKEVTMGKDTVGKYALAGIVAAKDEAGRGLTRRLVLQVGKAIDLKVSKDLVRKACKASATVALAIEAVTALIPGKSEGDKFSAYIVASRQNAVKAQEMPDAFIPTDTDRDNIKTAIAALQAMLARI
jgi:hypothetical protein